MSSSQIHKRLSKCNISAEKRFLYGKLGPYQKTREITAGHFYQGLGQSPQSFLMLELSINLDVFGPRVSFFRLEDVLLKICRKFHIFVANSILLCI